ncbi:hypothetical protein BSNK01_00270 [Bacillaceae bacterium]
MIISLRRLFEYVKLMLFFLLCTFIFYGVIQFLSDVIEPVNPYKKPEGKAVKVFSFDEASAESSLDWYRERLFFFYWYGE